MREFEQPSFEDWNNLNNLIYNICDASKWRRYCRRSAGYCSVLPLGTTAMVRDYRPWRWYEPSTTASGLPPLVRPYVTRGNMSAMRCGPIISLHATPAPLIVYIRAYIWVPRRLCVIFVACEIYDNIISVLNCSRPSSSSRLPTWNCLSRHNDGELRAPTRVATWTPGTRIATHCKRKRHISQQFHNKPTHLQ